VFHIATGNHVYRLLLDTLQSNSPKHNSNSVIIKGVESIFLLDDLVTSWSDMCIVRS
jgi:hypothetical protein